MASTAFAADGDAHPDRPAFLVLGSLEVRGAQGSVPVSGTVRQRTLAMLLLEAGRVIPVSRLVEAAWDEEPPRSAEHQIRKAVADLRRRIPGGHEVIVTDGPGYRAAVRPDQLDLARYQALVRRAHEALDAGDREAAAATLRSAVDLWRGPVLAGAGGSVIAAVSTALEEEYLSAAEQLYDLVITAGAASSVVGELRSLAVRHPLRESLRELLMRAFYQTGQQAAALDEFARLRDLLRDELGIDPSTRLCDLYEYVLRQDPSLATSVEPAAPRPAASAAPTPPQTLPYNVPDFSGRESELAWIAEAAARTSPGSATVLAVDGMGGGGKTALVLRAAHQLAPSYPDGQLFVDLYGFTPGQRQLSAFHAQGHLLAAAGIPSEEISGLPAGRNALWQSYMRGRRMLLILDNVASSSQVRSLLPASPGSLVLITSRPRLVDLDGVEWLSLGALPEADSQEMLRQTLGAERVEREPEAAAELLRLCGGLPLAVRIVAARLSNRPHWSVQHLTERLRAHGRRLEELTSENRGVASALSLSYRSMARDLRSAFRLLGHCPGQYVDTEEAAALLGVDPFEAENVLERLVDARLLQAWEPGVYTFHDLVRHFARRLAEEADSPEDTPGIQRLLDHYTLLAEHACDVLFPGRAGTAGDSGGPAGEAPRFRTKESALRWLDQHRDSLLAAVRLAHGRGLLRPAARLPRELGFHSSIRAYDAEANDALATGVAASRRLDDPALLRLNLTNLAMGQWRMGALRAAVSHLHEALEVARAMDDPRSEAECRARLGQAFNSLGELGRAVRLTEEANRAARETGFDRLDGSSLSTLSHVLARLGRFPEAAEKARRALELFDSMGEIQLAVDALRYLAHALAGTGRHAAALGHLDSAVQRCERLRMPSVLPLVLACRTDVLLRMGRVAQASESATHALSEALCSTDDIHRATVHLSAGRAFLASGNAGQALDQYRTAHDIATRMELGFERAVALDGLAAVHQHQGEGAGAESSRREADELFAAMGTPEEARAFWTGRP